MLYVHIPNPNKSDEGRRRDERAANGIDVALVALLLGLLALGIYYNSEMRAMEEKRHAQQVEECRADPEGCAARIREAEKEAESKASWWWLLL